VCLINLIESTAVYLCIEVDIHPEFGKTRKLFFEYVMGQTLPGDTVFYLASQFIHPLVQVNRMALQGQLPCSAESGRTSADHCDCMTRRLLFLRCRQIKCKASELVNI
jgi:hypothetical protein